MLIGASLFYELLCVGQIKLAAGLPVLQKTRLGWVVSGGDCQSKTAMALNAISSADVEDENMVQLDQIVRRFWEMDSSCSAVAKYTKEEMDCESHFKANFVRLPSGDYSVRLPIKSNISLLGESYSQALRRFLNLERKLERQPTLKAQYGAFIHEYLDLKHMSLVSESNHNLCKYFLPHHCVLKESTTTKLRVVFDGSAATSTGYSLNDVLMTGPTIQPKLFNTLLRFRTFPVALTGDICKMYRCVRVAESDSYLQCILWRDTLRHPIQIFKLDTVTYGTRPAAFLSVRSMHQLAFDEQHSFPVGSKILKRDFYVDDLITGGDSVQEVRQIMNEITEMFARGQFKLRKWCSNNSNLLRDIPPEDTETLLSFDDGTNITKTLGLTWDPASDCLLFTFTPTNTAKRNCKRSVLSTIARFYDPLGLIGPIISRAKIFLQHLWRERLNWDERLPSSLDSSWNSLYEDLVSIPKLCFPRLSIFTKRVVEVHGFSDASIEAYGACVYVVSGNEKGKQVHLVCSKSRVAPLKTLTVPKLELCGAALLSQLMHDIAEMNVYNCPFYCWSDSAVVLAWIRNEPSRFQVFTSNRIAQIQELTTKMEWNYVPTKLNPADILSRGASPSELIESPIWMHGPEFLVDGRNKWPLSCSAVKELPELRKKVLLAVPRLSDITLECKYNTSFTNLQHVFAYIYKFVHKARHPGLTVDDIRGGTKLLLRTIQMTNLRDDYSALKNGEGVRASSCIASLSPFIDDYGLLRVGGRLQKTALDFNAKHPIMTPSGNARTHHALP
ncbi:uncharacterized protein Indy isoform X1 [Eurosta solidaginis]|uniref:uncharacterized protein Indy isoform X1 n=1 Tax=Eurosta solidaginis TaxID=178769 RepID=UPI0035313584